MRCHETASPANLQSVPAHLTGGESDGQRRASSRLELAKFCHELTIGTASLTRSECPTGRDVRKTARYNPFGVFSLIEHVATSTSRTRVVALLSLQHSSDKCRGWPFPGGLSLSDLLGGLVLLHLDLYCSKCTRLKAGFGLQRVKADQKTTPAVSGWKEVPSVSRVSGRE